MDRSSVQSSRLGVSVLHPSSVAAILLELWGVGMKTQACLPPAPQHLARYVEQYVGTEGASSSPTEGFLLKPVFLQR